ncbi:MAG: helicase RepA family protein [Deltaproteobacteria bacterium]|nr:helicase RepA family protein [Deltaproteobacteria bacterium]
MTNNGNGNGADLTDIIRNGLAKMGVTGARAFDGYGNEPLTPAEVTALENKERDQWRAMRAHNDLLGGLTKAIPGWMIDMENYSPEKPFAKVQQEAAACLEMFAAGLKGDNDWEVMEAFKADAVNATRLAEIARSMTREMVLPGLKRGRVGSIIGPGGAGKSMYCLELVMAFAVAPAASDALKVWPVDLLEAGPLTSGRALLVAGEEDHDDLDERRQAVNSRIFRHGRTSYVENGTERNIDIFPPEKGVLEEFDRLIDENIVFNPFRGRRFPLSGHANDRKAVLMIDYIKSEGFKLVIFDPLVKFHNLKENDNMDMARLMNEFESIAKEAEATIILSHHVGKIAAFNSDESNDSAGASRGASALTDDIRKVDNLFVMSKRDHENCNVILAGRPIYPERWRVVKHAIVKCNNAAISEPKWYCRPDGVVMEPVQVVSRDSTGGGKQSGKNASSKMSGMDYSSGDYDRIDPSFKLKN